MARYKVIDQSAALYYEADGDRAMAHLKAGTEVGSIGQPVNGPPGHGKIVNVLVTITNQTGWIYVSQIQLLH